MDLDVSLHVAGMHKALAADGAAERLFSRVKALVVLQLMVAGESLGAVATAVRLLACVHAFVQSQVL